MDVAKTERCRANADRRFMGRDMAGFERSVPVKRLPIGMILAQRTSVAYARGLIRQ